MFAGKVLLASDFSDTAEKLINCLSELENMGIDEVLLVNVIDTRYDGVISNLVLESNEERMEQLVDKVENLGFKVEGRILIGSASKKIVELAEKEDVELILIASHGGGFLKQIFLGSTTYNVIRRSTKPVLVEKYKNIEENNEIACSQKFNRILIPIDFSDFGDKVSELIKKINKPVEEIILVSIVESSENRQELKQKKLETYTRLEKRKNKLKDFNIARKISIKVSEGIASKNIVDIAKAEKVGIIMMPTRGAGNIKRILLGSTADRVARRSSVPVLLIPCERQLPNS